MKMTSSWRQRLTSLSPSFLLLCSWWLALYWTFSSQWPRPFDDWKNSLLYVGGGLFCLYHLWRRRRELTFQFNLPILFLLLYLVVSLFSLQRPFYEGWLALARLILWAGLVWTLIQVKKEELWLLAKIGLFSAALIAISSFLKLGGVRLWPSFAPHFVPPVGYLTYYGEFMALHAPLAALFFLRSASWRERIFYATLFFLILGGLAVSATRTSLLAVIIGLGLGAFIGAFAGLVRWKVMIRAALALLVVPLIVLLIPIGFRGSMLSRFTSAEHGSVNASLSSKILGPRSIQYSKAYEMVKQRPLRGWGLGSFRFNYPIVAWQGDDLDPQFNASTWVMHPHNELLHQAVEVGIPGVLLSALFWLSLFFIGIRCLNATDLTTDRLSPLTGMVGLLIVGVSWQLSTNFLFPLSRLLAAFYVAIVLKEISVSTSPPVPLSLIRRGGNWIVLVVMTTATLFIGAYQASLYATVKAQRSRSEIDRATWAERAYWLAPGAIDPLLLAVAGGVNGVPIPNLEKKMRLLEDQYPEVPMALYFLALHEMQGNRIDRAVELVQHSLRLHRNFEGGKNLLSQLEAMKH